MASEAAIRWYDENESGIDSVRWAVINAFDAGAAAMRELMACGHPRACMVEDVPSESERPTLHCSECLRAAASEKRIAEFAKELHRKAIASREEAGRIRRTVSVATKAEANCLVRAEVSDNVAYDLASLLAGRDAGTE